jgi:ABC-type transporter Mla subunit MlaD
VQLDEGVGNLERFITVLTDTAGRLDQCVEALDDAARHLDDVEGDTEDTLGDFTGTLEEMAGDIGDAAGSTAEAFQSLAQKAHDIADDRCTEAANDASAAGDAFEEKAEGAGETLDTETASTVNDGFKLFGDTLDQAGREVQQAGADAEQAMEALGEGAAAGQADAEAAFTRAEATFDAAVADLGTHGTALEAAANEAAGALAGAEGDLEGECTNLGNEAKATYDTFADGAEAKAGELASEAEKLLEGAGEAVDTDASAPMTEALALAVDEAGGEYDGALDEVATVLGAAVDMSGELEPLIGELDKSQNVVGEVDRLLKAMEQ